jgi:hypothetical protein
MAIATYDDANLLLQLYDMRREEKLRAARDWFVKNARFQSMDDFRKLCPPGSPENASFRQVTSYWEMVASFVASGILHPDLFFQNTRELLLVWVRLRGIMPTYRESFKDPSAFRNLEHVAIQFIDWMNRQGPEAFEAFAGRVK